MVQQLQVIFTSAIRMGENLISVIGYGMIVVLLVSWDFHTQQSMVTHKHNFGAP